MNSDQILEHFKETDALLEGHFILSSGLHSGNYLQCALALQYPSDVAALGRAIAEHFLDADIDTVASPAIGGLIIGFAVAQALNVRFIWTERQEGIMTLRRGFALKKDERVLVVEDVITTGGSTRECIEALEKHEAKVVSADLSSIVPMAKLMSAFQGSLWLVWTFQAIHSKSVQCALVARLLSSLVPEAQSNKYETQFFTVSRDRFLNFHTNCVWTNDDETCSHS